MKSGSGLVLLVILFLLVACAIAANEAMQQPGYVFVDADTAFVYPVGQQVVLVTEQGEFNIYESLITGCYELIPAKIGQERGTAVWAGMVCSVIQVGQ